MTLILNSNENKIWSFQKSLRRAEYYKNQSGMVSKLLFILHHRRKNKKGRRLGFDIPEGCFGCGLRIYHISPVIVNPSAQIGENCIVVGNCCIGNVKGLKVAPQIGNDGMLGWGATVIGDIHLSDHCSVAAGAVVVKSIEERNVTLAGVPAQKIGS